MHEPQTVRVLSGVFKVRPFKKLFLNSAGPLCVTPKQIYHAVRTNYEIRNQPGAETIMIIKDGYRWFPVSESWARNNFQYFDTERPEGDNWWLRFNAMNEHIKTGVKFTFIRG